ncbi:uncharacterized protein BDZ99DRAFT_462492 [Mytilinidion resinicola]|uniref:Secreted protein n=1 Tax=Mytilinidion resinicola TaxID=574789 RepID=A0A6A6YRR6_9PEZI|nr:uncharacterized protein BDZ99DRAFT_462492 [Mytilinidion resinicola]KAF2811248.1 hypothetical protein BDZ99DRAFT_462492 [Mytilinidion resinicola]
MKRLACICSALLFLLDTSLLRQLHSSRHISCRGCSIILVLLLDELPNSDLVRPTSSLHHSPPHSSSIEALRANIEQIESLALAQVIDPNLTLARGSTTSTARGQAN